MVANKLLESVNTINTKTDIPEGVSFDGSTDYLSRSSDLVGNVDSKTFTFSCWFYYSNNSQAQYIIANEKVGDYQHLQIAVNTDSTVKFYAKTGTNAQIFNFNTVAKLALNTFNHIVVSIDTNSRLYKCYIQDIADTQIPTISNYTIDFTTSKYWIGRGIYYTSVYLKGRLSHVFLDYTYRDLSIEANRRLFITVDGKPASGLETLNPILYLPMKDASTAHINLGTGGDFVQNGTLATTDRGANQDNCVASKFDGVVDYLSRTSLTGLADGKQFTFSCNASAFQLKTYGYSIFSSNVGTASYCNIFINGAGGIEIIWKNSSNVIICYFQSIGSAGINKTNVISCSVDLTDTTKRHVLVNGISVLGTWYTYTNANMFTSVSYWNVAKLQQSTSELSNGNIGELYFDTAYIDLATNNPFWDSKTNKPIPVRKAMANLGSNPLICMPISADNPTKNYGSGGDFTLNGGGLTGARGASEFWARSVKTGQYAYNYLEKVVSVHTTKFSCCFSFFTPDSNYHGFLQWFDGTSTEFLIKPNYGNVSGDWVVTSPVGSDFNAWSNTHGSFQFSSSGWNHIFISIDYVAKTRTLFFINQSGSTKIITSFNVGSSLTFNKLRVCNLVDTSFFANLYMSTTNYIDFSQESNRNLFVNQLGYPRDLSKEIKAGNIPTPLIYLPFDDTSNLGKNLGTGGDFVVNGSVTPGADFAI